MLLQLIIFICKQFKAYKKVTKPVQSSGILFTQLLQMLMSYITMVQLSKPVILQNVLQFEFNALMIRLISIFNFLFSYSSHPIKITVFNCTIQHFLLYSQG